LILAFVGEDRTEIAIEKLAGVLEIFLGVGTPLDLARLRRMAPRSPLSDLPLQAQRMLTQGIVDRWIAE
jgi:hypothetical protein